MQPSPSAPEEKPQADFSAKLPSPPQKHILWQESKIKAFDLSFPLWLL